MLHRFLLHVRAGRFLAHVAALLVLLAGPAAAQQSDAAWEPAAEVDAVFASVSGLATPGCAVGVSREGRPVLLRAYGMADLEHEVPNTPGTIFEAGSVSKQFTAAAVVLLAQDGKLSLEDDVRKYIPEVPDYGAPITIRHLLTHTSGLRDWGSVAAISGWPRTTRVHGHEHVLDIVSRQSALNYPPGEYYSYTNSGYNLLAILVERVSGMPFAEFSRERIFEPVGMRDTEWRDDYTRIVKGRSVAYRGGPDGEFRMLMPFENVHGNGGLLTTVADLLLWTENLETGRVGGAGFLAEMHRQGRLNGGREIEYASGLMINAYRDVPQVSHSGSTAGYRAFLTRFPDPRLAIAVLCNGAFNATGFAQRVADLYLGDAGPSEAPVAAVAVDREALSARAGLYRETRTGEPLRLEMRGSQLAMADGAALVPLSATRFRAGSSEIAFAAAPEPGGRAAFDLLRRDGDTFRYEPVADYDPSPSELAELTGRYHSADAEVTYTVVVDGSDLVVRERYGAETRLDPAYPGAFTGGGTLYRFVQGPDGRITELSTASDRVWDMRFRRQP